MTGEVSARLAEFARLNLDGVNGYECAGRRAADAVAGKKLSRRARDGRAYQ